MQQVQLPDIDDVVRKFAERHFLLGANWLLEHEKVGVFWTACCNIVLQQGCHLNPELFASEPSAGFLINMLDRTFEHVEAALTTYITGSAPSAEVVARTAIESATNVLYILAGDKMERLQSWFYAYFDQVDDQVRKWNNAADKLSGNQSLWHKKGAQHRKIANDQVRQFIDAAMSQADNAGTVSAPRWPNIAEKFDALGAVISYRTVYARMCSQTHNDAEDTIRYFIGKISDEKTMEKLALETIHFSRLLVYFSVSYYFKASIKFAEGFGLEECSPTLQRGYAAIDRQLEAISREVGSSLLP